MKGVSLTLLRGEIHALVGENGAGKSTLIKVFTGAIEPDAGELRIGGEKIQQNSPANARAHGVGVIYQQPALFPDLTVAENIALAREGSKVWHKVNWKGIYTHASQVLERVGARFRPDVLVSTLTMPEQQLVEIAKALDVNASILILDEPTASLGDEDAESLFALIQEIRTKGAAVIYISHRFEELFRLADRVTVLRDGNSIETRPMHGISSQDLIRLMVGRELKTVFPKRSVNLGEVALDVQNASCKRLGVNDVNLQIRAGEILGLAGLVGSGRTQFAEALFGLEPLDGGTVSVYGKPVVIRSPLDALASGFAYVPEDRRRHGVILDMSVEQNMTLASLKRISDRLLLNSELEEKLASEYVTRLAVKTHSMRSPVGNLSGGNQQKVALARWLITEPKILILDEPTQGIDVGAKFEIYELIGRLAAAGMAILMISSEISEILGMSDRVAVMSKGQIAGVLSREDATPFRILELALGHQPSVPPLSPQ